MLMQKQDFYKKFVYYALLIEMPKYDKEQKQEAFRKLREWFLAFKNNPQKLEEIINQYEEIIRRDEMTELRLWRSEYSNPR